METKPFHESIVSAIKKAKTPEALDTLADLVKKTKIPKDHEEIRKAFASQAKKMDWDDSELDAM
jgi:hypothetical protein